MASMTINLDKFNLTEEQAIEALTYYEELLDDYCKVVDVISDGLLSKPYPSKTVIGEYHRTMHTRCNFAFDMAIDDYCASTHKEDRTLKDFVESLKEYREMDKELLENMLTCLEQE